jgi:CheY-like chemotaxis protein
MNHDMLNHALRALRSFGGEHRLVFLAREPATFVTSLEAADALQTLASQNSQQKPLVGWWQEPDTLAHTAQIEKPAQPDAAVMDILLEGEWTVGNTTLQLRRVGSTLLLNRIMEVGNTAISLADADVQRALAQTHTLIGRTDLNVKGMEVAVYSVWDDDRQQVVPVAQRLLTLCAA